MFWLMKVFETFCLQILCCENAVRKLRTNFFVKVKKTFVKEFLKNFHSTFIKTVLDVDLARIPSADGELCL